MTMPVHERRQHFRIDDHIYFDYQILAPGEFCSDIEITNQLLGENGQKYMEAAQYFQGIDYELAELTQVMAVKEPALAHYLNLLNAKIDYLSRQMLMSSKVQLRKVNISLGGMAFKTMEQIREKTNLKIILYTKPKMIPIIVDAVVVYSQYQSEAHYRTAVAFCNLTSEQEQLLSQHILQAQIKSRAD
ncbi:TPA: PilZ domain-containing protein [Legionella pneumophila subsp. pneumophila]|nr:PilZ domain-containing protein [Legionella pneumophila]HAT8940678.1 PilZ domain-containing protein [Legionella pneumophila subsp. pneumophila]RYW92318.1 PilZ domain-containing protein [Legionella pneumophila]HAT9031292.1 PilZ domain-containing protein [Legionella pneumophila subsp. pneumophila]HAU0123413.1 PilZ domain-containing protein [Legionella pneumophila]